MGMTLKSAFDNMNDSDHLGCSLNSTNVFCWSLLAYFRSLFTVRVAIVGFLIVSFLLFSSCVTTTDNRFSKKANKQKALENYVTVSLTYIQKNNIARAKKAATRALEIDDDYAPAHDAMALIMEKEGEVDLADRHFKKAVKLDKSFSRARSHYGAFLYVNQRYKEACKQLEIAASDVYYESRPLAYENLALCYLKLEKQDAAINAYKKANQLNPSQPRPVIGLSRLYMQSGDAANAKTYYRVFLQHVRNKTAAQTARTLWLGIQIALATNDRDTAASYGLVLRNQYGNTAEYKAYKDRLAQEIAKERELREKVESGDRLLTDPSDIVVSPRPAVVKESPEGQAQSVENNTVKLVPQEEEPFDVTPVQPEPNLAPIGQEEGGLVPIDLPYENEKK